MHLNGFLDVHRDHDFEGELARPPKTGVVLDLPYKSHAGGPAGEEREEDIEGVVGVMGLRKKQRTRDPREKA